MGSYTYGSCVQHCYTIGRRWSSRSLPTDTPSVQAITRPVFVAAWSCTPRSSFPPPRCFPVDLILLGGGLPGKLRFVVGVYAFVCIMVSMIDISATSFCPCGRNLPPSVHAPTSSRVLPPFLGQFQLRPRECLFSLT